jgi:flagellar basal body-associated protein FliL
MAKDLLKGIVDKDSGDLLNRKGEHVKVNRDGKLADPNAAPASDRSQTIKLVVAIGVLAIAGAIIVWQFTSTTAPGPVGGVDVAGPDPTKVTGKNERIEAPNRRTAMPQ